MTTIQDRIIKDFRDRFNNMDKFGVIYSKNHSIPILENSSNQLEVIEQFLIQSIKEAEEETRKETLEELENKLYDNWHIVNGSWKDMHKFLQSITNKEKQK